MLRRLLGGLLGLLLGLGVGAPLSYSSHVALTPTLGLLVSMGVAACVLTLVRRPPWRHEDAVESLLRVVLGFMVGALLDLASRRFLDHALPFVVPPLPRGVTWLEHPAILGAYVGFVVGVLVGIEPAPAKIPPPVKADASGASGGSSSETSVAARS